MRWPGRAATPRRSSAQTDFTSVYMTFLVTFYRITPTTRLKPGNRGLDKVARERSNSEEELSLVQVGSKEVPLTEGAESASPMQGVTSL